MADFLLVVWGLFLVAVATLIFVRCMLAVDYILELRKRDQRAESPAPLKGDAE